MQRMLHALAFGVGAIVAVSAPARAADVTANHLEGQVKDALQRPLDGARVSLQGADGRTVGTTTSDAKGHFAFAGVPPGTYAVQAAKTGFETATAIVTLTAGAGAATDLVLASKQALDLRVTAERLAAARSEIEPRIGATTYTLGSDSIQNQPGGADIPLNQTLLQAPGVSQDSFGQIHLRNDHANIQYRINGVILPEGISFFGQSLTSRFASSIDLITGSLPAQYGLVTTGIVDIQTKSGAFQPGGSVGLYGGSHGWLEPSAEYAGSAGHFNYYVAGDYMQNGIGIENPTSSHDPIHDDTRQGHGFAYFEDILDPASKLSVVLGAYQGGFQIPNRPGQTPAFALGTQTAFDSTALNETQQESNDYAAVAYLKSTQDYDFQVSTFSRYSRLAYSPDPIGDLMFYGIAERAVRTDLANGVQADATYRLANGHTLRYGALITAEYAAANTSSQVFPCNDPACTSVGTSPVSIADSSSVTAWTYSAYLQDEWQIMPTVTINYGARFDVLNGFTDANQL
ncbi:MAG TPA: TonB-dependent receptor, partial [Candidatus Sulfotelmatobacter sp.]|nr:TonB-dependent receptor [Candidatus Sulfotelmatobacter sp.]